MSDIEIANPDQAKSLVLQGLCLCRAVRMTPTRLKPTLAWALALVSEGLALPPIGFVADLGHIALGFDRDVRAVKQPVAMNNWDALLRTYEDHVLGKIFADRSLDRAADVLRKLSGKDQARGLAFVIDQFHARAGFPGMHISPAVIKALVELPGDEVITRAWATLESSTLDPILEEMYQRLIAAVRQSAEMLGPEDVFELEHGTALADFGQRVALRQVLRAVDQISDSIPKRPPSFATQRREVPTRILDEDAYPVGGFASISNRGGIESLLQSQLAMMETDAAERPDMFDIKFLRDELLYYSRDENQFLRQRRRFAIRFDESLTASRFKDPSSPFQRIILALAAVVAIVRTAREWLDRDELTIVIEFAPALADEMTILKTVLRDEIGLQMVVVRVATPAKTKKSEAAYSRSLDLTATPGQIAELDRIEISSPSPALFMPEQVFISPYNDGAIDDWSHIVTRLLVEWIRTGS